VSTDVPSAEELAADIAKSRAVQRKMRWVLAVGGVVAAGLWIAGAGTGAGLIAAAVTAIVAGSGWWITNGHIQDFERQLATLRKPRTAPSASTATRDPSR